MTFLLILLLKHAEENVRKVNLETYPYNSDLVNELGNDTLIDFQGFLFLKQNDQLCQNNNLELKNSTVNDSKNLLLILILSSRENYAYRNVIRKTWASVFSIGNWNIKYAFLIGSSSLTNTDTILENKISQEWRKNQDLIIGNFIDSYKNLSYKQLMGYKWALRYCTEAKFILKTDDDVFVDSFQLVKYVDSLINHDKIIVGHVNYNSLPQRTEGSKWFVSQQEYSKEFYPDYCMGMGFIMSFDVVKLLYEASIRLPYFWVEDVYVTGILREEVQYREGIDLKMIALNKKFIFTDGIDNAFILWLYNNNHLEKCREDTKSVKELPWIFVHCWGEDISVHFEQLWLYLINN